LDIPPGIARAATGQRLILIFDTFSFLSLIAGIVILQSRGGH
jgi:hypothetical protein